MSRARVTFAARTGVATGPRAPIAPDMRAHIAEADRFFAGLAPDADIGVRRAAYDAMSRHFLGTRPAGISVRDSCFNREDGTPLAVRVYVPRCAEDTPRPVLIYLHGGGFWFGDLDSHDTVVAELAAAAGVVAVAVDYRRTPEHLFPAALGDARTVLRHVAERALQFGGDARRIVVAGDSCGGTLAANLAASAAADADGPQVMGQLLIYPVLGIDFDTPSYRDNADAPMLDRQTMIDCWEGYLPRAMRTADMLAAAVPNLAPVPSGLAPAAILTAAHDPVADDGRIFADRLGAAGIATAYRCDADLPHGHLRARGHCRSAAAAFAWCCEALRALASRS